MTDAKKIEMFQFAVIVRELSLSLFESLSLTGPLFSVLCFHTSSPVSSLSKLRTPDPTVWPLQVAEGRCWLQKDPAKLIFYCSFWLCGEEV